MSGFLVVTGTVSPERMDSALARLAYFGGDQEQVWSQAGAVVAVTRKSWELGADFSGPVLVLESANVVVAADASLYARQDLLGALEAERVVPAGMTPSHLIEAAYRAWGPALVGHLVGDYAFAIWDRRSHRLVAARDPLGMRSLFFTRVGSQVAVASSSGALAELSGRSGSLNLACLGAQVAGVIWSNGTETAFEGVSPVPAGHLLIWEEGRTRTERFWQPPVAPARRPSETAEAAVELQALLGRATVERMAGGVNAVWMSGGWDSTAVFAAGQQGLPPSERSRLRPVSISYPEGDPGCEDEFIRQVSARWGAEPHWIPSEAIPLLDGLEERAALADEPPTHLYELWNRELARGTRAIGARVALDGCGGDNLFQVSDVVLADLLRTGHLIEFARLARSRRQAGWKHLARAGVLPLLPDAVLRAGERVAGRRIPRHHMEHAAAPWMRPSFVAAHRLRERALATLRSTRGASLAQTENMLYVSAPAWSWAGGYMRGVLLQEGVEARSPLLDLRVVEFALARPVAERTAGGETKILLRRAMDGLLPASVLAPRAHRTGSTAGFSRRRMREAYPALLNRLFSQPLRLAELGIVDPGLLRAAADRWAASGDESVRVGLFDAMRIEFWLRSRERHSPTIRPREASQAALAASSAA
jgi:asparagine synthase (glutamine-hydrolysing)